MTSTDTEQVSGGASHHLRTDSVRSRPKRVLIVVANPTTNQYGWPVGYWAAELTHPYFELTERGIQVTMASPGGGKVVDALSDPRDESEWSSDDLISMGFFNTPDLVSKLDDTPAIGDLDLDQFDAIMVAGGQAPMFSYRDNKELHRVIRTFYEAEKPVAVPPDRQHSRHGVPDIARRLGGPARSLQGLRSTFQEDNSSQRGGHSPGGAFQEVDTEHSFELAHLTAEDLLGHGHPAAGGGKPGLLGHRHKVAQVAQLDVRRDGLPERVAA
jgi:hypothetical protein